MSVLVNVLLQWMTTLSVAQVNGISVHQLPGLPGAQLELRFSNPHCQTHFYSSPQLTNSGNYVEAKPAHAYCKGKQNFYDSFEWSHSPRAKLIEWIRSPETKEIFFAFQSISDTSTLRAICEEIQSRHLKVTFVISRHRGGDEEGGSDKLIDLSEGSFEESPKTINKFNRAMNKLTGCGLDTKAPRPKGIIRGHTGQKESNSIGWAHNKLFVLNPGSKDHISFATGSGNLTSIGVSTNHENWLFFESIPTHSHLAQETLCLVKAQLDDVAHLNRFTYENFITRCKMTIPSHYSRVAGIKSYFIPGEGGQAIEEVLVPAFSTSRKITMAAHLMGYPHLFLRGMTCAASSVPLESCFEQKGEVPGFAKTVGQSSVRLMIDDDIHWIREGQTDDKGQVGFNDQWEAYLVEQMEEANVKVGYIQTAHQGDFIQLHHNKILLFEEGPHAGVWTGAGNFTASAMQANFENYYFITLPSVVKAYQKQIEMMWNDWATPWGQMPIKDVSPKSPHFKDND